MPEKMDTERWQECFARWQEWFALGQVRKIAPPDFPTIVCLCGSTRFGDAFRDALRNETLAGKIVLSVGLLGHSEGIDMNGPVKVMLDELHKRKIDLADEVLVLNCKRGRCTECCKWFDYPDEGTCSCGSYVQSEPYIGSSTRSEIKYAQAHGKVIRYLESKE